MAFPREHPRHHPGIFHISTHDCSSQVWVLVEFPLAEGKRRRPLVGRCGQLLLLERSWSLTHDAHGTVLLQKAQRGRVWAGSARVPAGGRGAVGTGRIVQLVHGLRHRGQGCRCRVCIQTGGGAEEWCFMKHVGVGGACRGVGGLASQGSAPCMVVGWHQWLLCLLNES